MLPANLSTILWSKNLKNVDLAQDKVYIIHQVLAFGELEDIRWLFKTFTQDEIFKVFLESPQKVYTKSSFNFAKNIILKLKVGIDEKKYLKGST